MHFDVEKNKLAPPFREGDFRIIFDYGLDDVFSNLDFLKKHQNREKGDKSVEFNGETKTLSYMTAYVEKEGLESKLQAEVVKVWRQLYKPSERKPREWK